MTQLFVDRIEDDVAVLLVGDREIQIPASLLPKGTREGEVLKLERDPEATARAKSRVGELRDSLGEGDDGGDIEL